MIPAAFDYAAPETLGEALRLLAEDDEAKLLAGGHSLIPTLKLRLAAPSKLIDLGRIPELQFIAESDGAIRVGAMTTHHQIESSDLLREKCPLLAETAGHIGDVQVRHRGTIGGSAVHADPAADYPAALLALEAKVKLVGAKGERVLDYEEFLVEALTTAIEPGEILTEIHVPVETGGAAYSTIMQAASGYAVVGVAARAHVEGEKVAWVRVGVTGLASKPYRARAVEDYLVGKVPSEPEIAAAAARAAEGQEALSDLHAGPDYRAHLAAVHARRALLAAFTRT